MRIEVNGVRIFFDIEGAKLVPDGPVMREKPTLILLHGGPGMDHTYWRPLFSQLADVAQVIYIDQRGCGRSDRGSKGAWTLAQWGDDVHAFCAALDIDRPVVCGSSFGGEVAMAYAARHPDHPSKLMLLSASARLNLDYIGAAFDRLGGPAAREAAERFWRDGSMQDALDYMRVCVPLYFRTPQDADRDARAIPNTELTMQYLAAGGEAQRCNFLPDLPRIQCPTLVMGGEDDPVTTIDDMADIASALPSHLVRFERIPNCGHGTFFDAPERTLAVIREFIATEVAA